MEKEQEENMYNVFPGQSKKMNYMTNPLFDLNPVKAVKIQNLFEDKKNPKVIYNPLLKNGGKTRRRSKYNKKSRRGGRGVFGYTFTKGGRGGKSRKSRKSRRGGK